MRHLTKNCFLNSCDNTSRIQCNVGVENESKHVMSVTKNHHFGFVPSDSLQMYTGEPVSYETIQYIISTHLMFKKSGLPNFLKCRIPVKSKLKVDRWHFHLTDYWDQQLPDLLVYGFPIDFNQDF